MILPCNHLAHFEDLKQSQRQSFFQFDQIECLDASAWALLIDFSPDSPSIRRMIPADTVGGSLAFVMPDHSKKSRHRFHRIVLKFGSATLTRTKAPGLDFKQFARLSAEVAALIRRGHECVTVTSGAVAAGTSVLALHERPDDLATAQASAAIGQSKLMRAYEMAFGRYKLNVAQLLLTHSDLDSRTRRANAGNTLERLLAADNVVPIINENDSVATEELTFGDNDRLSAEVATLARADLLIILTQVEGLLDAEGKVIPFVRNIDQVKALANGDRGKFSRGGMVSKLEAVRMAVDAGIETVIVNGRRLERIPDVIAGKAVGTRFLPKTRVARRAKLR